MATTQEFRASLYIGNLDLTITERDIFQAIKDVEPEHSGDIESIKLVKDWNTGNSLGYGYINFKNVQSATIIQNKINHHQIKSKKVRCNWQRKKDEFLKEANIFSRVAPTFTDEELDTLFAGFGVILSNSYKPLTNKYIKALCQYKTKEEADRAIQGIDGKSLKGIVAKAGIFISKKDRTPKPNVLLVQSLPSSVTENDLKELFPQASSIYIYSRVFSQNGMDFKCSAITFPDHEIAKKNLEEKNGSSFKESSLSIQWFQKKKDRHNAYPQGLNLYINHIPLDVSEAALTQLFSKYGKIISLRLMLDNDKKKSLGYGYCSFESKEQTTNAQKALNGYSFQPGSSMLVEPYKTKAERMTSKSVANNTMNKAQLTYNVKTNRPKNYHTKFNNIAKKNTKKQQHAQKPQQAVIEIEPIPAEEFRTMLDDDKREAFGEKIYNYIEKAFPGINVGKITGCLRIFQE